MLIYAGTKSDFMIDTENDCLETKLYENIKLKMNRTTGLSELNAWRNSLKEMYITLNDSDIRLRLTSLQKKMSFTGF